MIKTNRLFIQFQNSILFLALILVVGFKASALPYQAQNVVTAGPSPYAPMVAQEIAKAGGNVVDQAVAIALSMAVTHPYYASLGGGGFAMIRLQNSQKQDARAEVKVLDYRETAPASANSETYLKLDGKASQFGRMASGVPGVSKGLFALHKAHGKQPWKKLFAPAIRLAEKGFPVSGEWVANTNKSRGNFNATALAVFSDVKKDKSVSPLKPGDTLRQPLLAKALKKLRDLGGDRFTNEVFAKDVVKTLSEDSKESPLQVADFKNYTPVWRKPLVRTWRGFQFYLMPLPSSGGFIISQALEILDRIEKKNGVPKQLSAAEAHQWAETLKLSFAARGMMGDPLPGSAQENLQSQLEAKLLDPARLDRLAKLFSDDSAIQVMSSKSPDLKEALNPPVPQAEEKKETTHFSIADKDGNSVAITTTLNGTYGSGVVTKDLGIALNNEMDDFNTRPGESNMYGLVQGAANNVAPGKRPLSSMSPTIIEKDGKFVAALGAPGGPRIPSAVWQSALRILVLGRDAEEAVSLPRVHHQFLPDQVYFDSKKTSADTESLLKKFGHKLEDGWIAKAYIVRRLESGTLEGAGDPRGEAAAGGF